MKHLVIGATGFIGSALLKHLKAAGADVQGTARRQGLADHAFDLRAIHAVPDADVVYICAGANGAKACEGNQEAFLVNVDAPIRIAEEVGGRGGFTVFISSMSIEWMGAAYQRQKLAAETVLRTRADCAVVRAGRVTRDNLGDLCRTLAMAGTSRFRGLWRWGNDEIAYQK